MRRPVLAVALLAAVGALGCSSPEASRVRGGDPGADVGNRREVVEIHAGARPYYRTPCAVSKRECTGPESVFGTDRTLD
ncbi:MAG: hypothetical protein GWN99_00640 [Gemmatimonadetes bacterium]|uniref:Lipoprotein n=1 Tax=Candidatus Kutchimonas denitrificans TaxID=3056748 RepID=A0AAE4ZA70_9BACT|nr:hypothetical protein [Gemmatimonadota bacterium]NIR73615.1 hypothetical protein [Candidatus Kutchimonas denitrificans]NIR99574.1 hypothetical protein [Gemmatimonadota bacterium]NIT65194.1 hypothetical protein [Gemmatimonadota bacterium]NIV23727.1 hypothetical protein [Gemmatimonadota bacterium]